MSELELLYSKACGLPIYMKESKKLEGKISSTKVNVVVHDSLAHYFSFLVLCLSFHLYCLYFETIFLSKERFFIYKVRDL